MKKNFEKRLDELKRSHKELIKRKNRKKESSNGIYERFEHPVLTAKHTPLFWRYDLNKGTNPHLMERFGINAVFNSTAIKWKKKYLLVARVEGVNRKSFFAVAESPNGVDNFKFWDHPITIPENGNPDVNIYDMRVVQHEDGWIYGIFCTERRDPKAPEFAVNRRRPKEDAWRTNGAARAVWLSLVGQARGEASPSPAG